MLKPVGHKIPWPGKPPYHWQCRTTLVPWLKSFSELAGPSSKLPKDKIKKLESLNPGQRASLTYGEKGLGVGKRVSGEMTYNDWLLTQPESIQVDVLGPHRHKLWKEHKLGMEDLVHQNGRPLTIAELEKNLGLTMEEIEELASFELPMGKEGISPDAFEQYLKKDVGISSDRLKAFVEKNLTEDMKKNLNYKDYRYFADNLVTDDEAGQIRN